MKILRLVIAVVVTASVAQTAQAGLLGCLKPRGCGQTIAAGCCATPNPACSPKTEMVKVTKTCYKPKQAAVCIPPIKFPWMKCNEFGCPKFDASIGSRKKKSTAARSASSSGSWTKRSQRTTANAIAAAASVAASHAAVDAVSPEAAVPSAALTAVVLLNYNHRSDTSSRRKNSVTWRETLQRTNEAGCVQCMQPAFVDCGTLTRLGFTRSAFLGNQGKVLFTLTEVAR